MVTTPTPTNPLLRAAGHSSPAALIHMNISAIIFTGFCLAIVLIWLAIVGLVLSPIILIIFPLVLIAAFLNGLWGYAQLVKSMTRERKLQQLNGWLTLAILVGVPAGLYLFDVYYL